MRLNPSCRLVSRAPIQGSWARTSARQPLPPWPSVTSTCGAETWAPCLRRCTPWSHGKPDTMHSWKSVPHARSRVLPRAGRRRRRTSPWCRRHAARTTCLTETHKMPQCGPPPTRSTVANQATVPAPSVPHHPEAQAQARGLRNVVAVELWNNTAL